MASGSKLLLRLFSSIFDTVSEYNSRSSVDSAHKIKTAATSAIAETFKDKSLQETKEQCHRPRVIV